MNDKKYCYRYVEGNDTQGRPIVMLWVRVIIRETEKTFWHCYDYHHMTLEQLKQFESRPKNGVKRCLKGAARSSYHLTKEEALRAFVYRKMYQLKRMSLTMETANMCLDGLRKAGHVSDGAIPATVTPPLRTTFVASEELGPVAASFKWGEY
ncbi:hypothetical protein GW590_08365 [Rahnella sp. SAP-1]|uniref:Uncharacterized protein n=1 Tax=Rouxiella aceris TaxID=2703884 RepID=A0A848MHT1_9GAMM|nr:hypothetical protein [Rouxiella aceris]NMP26876.1 hypothetical protein [Rouxiella aceris]